jgi:hypothetical protein
LSVLVDLVDDNQKDEVFPNIIKSHLHNIVARKVVFPCEKVTHWIIKNVGMEERTIVNDSGQCISYFLPSALHKYYKFVEIEVQITMKGWQGLTNISTKVLEKCWIKGK